jgi:hypothetical protein
VEQQGKTVEELNAQWSREYWRGLFEEEAAEFERLIAAFNREVGLSGGEPSPAAVAAGRG